MKENNLSRRQLLFIAAVGGSMVGLSACTPRRPDETPEDVEYRNDLNLVLKQRSSGSVGLFEKGQWEGDREEDLVARENRAMLLMKNSGITEFANAGKLLANLTVERRLSVKNYENRDSRGMSLAVQMQDGQGHYEIMVNQNSAEMMNEVRLAFLMTREAKFIEYAEELIHTNPTIDSSEFQGTMAAKPINLIEKAYAEEAAAILALVKKGVDLKLDRNSLHLVAQWIRVGEDLNADAWEKTVKEIDSQKN